jgi:hypothetical protein
MRSSRTRWATIFFISFSFQLAFAALDAAPTRESARPVPKDLQLDVKQRAVQYFVEQSHPVTGLVRDAAENFADTPATNRMASIAATGFGLAVIAHASTEGLVTAAYAKSYVLKTLKYTRDHVPRRKGWMMHFVNWETGVPYQGSEYSTIDTAIFMSGALYAAQIFPEPEIAAVTRQLYVDLDFQDMLTDGGTRPDKKTLSMAYFPDRGYTPAQWDMPAEEMFLYLLGIGHPTRPLPPTAWQAWRRDSLTLPDGRVLIGADMPLFVHQYSQVFVDFRNFRDGFQNYYTNGAIATEYNRATCQKNTKYQTYREGFWGLSAGFTPDGYGAASPIAIGSTACLGCVLGSMMYDATTVWGDFEKWMNGRYRERIWGRYGITDSIDLDRNWFSPQVLGITVGPLYLSLANLSPTNSIWSKFQEVTEIQKALADLQITKIARPARP